MALSQSTRTGGGAAMDYGIHGGAEGHGGGDHFVTGTDAAREHGEVEGGGAGIDGNGEARALVSREFGLELVGPGSGPDPSAPHAPDHLLDLLLFYEGSSEDQKILPGADRVAPFQGEAGSRCAVVAIGIVHLVWPPG